LAALEERPWRALPAGKGKEPKPITQNRLAMMLKDFQIAPRKLRLGDTTPNGFERKDFEDAWLRYPPPKAKPENEAENSETPKNDVSGWNSGTTLRGVGESA